MTSRVPPHGRLAAQRLDTPPFARDGLGRLCVVCAVCGIRYGHGSLQQRHVDAHVVQHHGAVPWRKAAKCVGGVRVRVAKEAS